MRTRGFEKHVATLLSASGNQLFGLTAVEIATAVSMEVVQVLPLLEEMVLEEMVGLLEERYVCMTSGHERRERAHREAVERRVLLTDNFPENRSGPRRKTTGIKSKRKAKIQKRGGSKMKAKATKA